MKWVDNVFSLFGSLTYGIKRLILLFPKVKKAAIESHVVFFTVGFCFSQHKESKQRSEPGRRWNILMDS